MYESNSTKMDNVGRAGRREVVYTNIWLGAASALISDGDMG